MLLHATLVEQFVADKKVPLVDRAAKRRICRANDDAFGAKGIGECVSDRTDIAFGLESKVEQYLKRNLLAP
jgi:hypothetical protein